MNSAIPQRNMLMRNSLWRAPVLLVSATLIALAAAFWAVGSETREMQEAFTPRPMFDIPASRINQTEKIVYTIGRGMGSAEKITLSRDAQGWSVAEREAYPADAALVARVLSGFAGMTRYEKRTSKATWHEALGLGAPEQGGKATRIELFDGSGEKIEGLLIGKQPSQMQNAVSDPQSSGQAAAMVYVRRDGEDQVWLAHCEIPLPSTARDWLSPVFLGLGAGEIAKVTLWADSKRAVILSRATPEEDFVIENLPRNRATRGGPVMNSVASAIASLSFEDAVRADGIDFSKPVSTVRIETFDGLALRMNLAGEDTLWAEVSADGGKAEEINKRLSGWAYRLSPDAASILTQGMDVLTHAGGL